MFTNSPVTSPVRNLLVLALFTAAALSGQSRCPSPGEETLTRPTVNGEPTPVAISIYVSDVTEVNDVRQTFTADLYLFASWADPRVSKPGTPTARVKCEDME